MLHLQSLNLQRTAVQEMQLQENTLFILESGYEKCSPYPLHHVICAPRKLEVASSAV